MLNNFCNISFKISCLVTEVPLYKLCRADCESVHITLQLGCLSSIHCNANDIAISSVVKTDV